MKVALACLLVALAALAPASAEDSDLPDPYALVEMDGAVKVPYYMAHGTLEGSTLSMGTAMGGPRTMPFEGCAFMMMRPFVFVEDDQGNIVKQDPPTHTGVMRVIGILGNETLVSLTINNLAAPDGEKDLALDVLVEPKGSEPQHPTVPAAIAGWGEAGLRIQGLSYPDPARVDEEGLPVNRTQGRFYIAKTGFRDDASGQVGAPAMTPEMHLHIESLPGASADPMVVLFTASGDLPDGTLLPSEAHSAVYPFDNAKFGGKATVRVQAESNAPPGSNAITFEVHSPSGLGLGNLTLTPGLQAPASHEFTFPLDEFGVYAVTAHGKVALAKYTIQAELQPPSEFGLDFWWDHVLWGQEARDAHDSCKKAIETGTGTPLQVYRTRPPAYNLQAVLVGVGAGAIAVAILVNLVVFKVGTSRFRKKFRN